MNPESALFWLVAQADPDSVDWAVQAFECHSKNEERLALNPAESRSKNRAKPWFSNQLRSLGPGAALTCEIGDEREG